MFPCIYTASAQAGTPHRCCGEISFSSFVLCFRIVSINYFNTPLLEEGGAGGNPGADLHTAPPFQHPYTRKSTTTPSGANSVFAGLPMVKLSKNNNKYIRTRLPHQCTWYSVYRVYVIWKINGSLLDITFANDVKTYPVQWMHSDPTNAFLDCARSSGCYPSVRSPHTTPRAPHGLWTC